MGDFNIDLSEEGDSKKKDCYTMNIFWLKIQSYKIRKMCSLELVSPITSLINFSFTIGTFPDMLKTAISLSKFLNKEIL